MYQLKQVPSETQIRKYLRRILFGKNLFCPKCRSRQILVYENRYRCKKCRVRFTLVSHTWLKGMKLSYQKFWLILWCWTTQIPVKQSVALTELSEEAVRRWYDKFRSNLPQNQAILEKIIQLDEAYFKRAGLMMGKQQGTRKVAFEIFFKSPNEMNKQDALFFLQSYVKPKSKLRTDGAGIYRGIHNWWPVRHQKDIHRKWEFELTSEIEGLFGNLRTFIRRMYHHVTPEKLPEFVSEFCFRFSSPEIFDSPLSYLQKTLTFVPFD
jgi:transposase-like protein